jgi:adenylylsulfate kinase
VTSRHVVDRRAAVRTLHTIVCAAWRQPVRTDYMWYCRCRPVPDDHRSVLLFSWREVRAVSARRGGQEAVEPSGSMPALRVVICGGSGDGKSGVARHLAAAGIADGHAGCIVVETSSPEHLAVELASSGSLPDVTLQVIDASAGWSRESRVYGTVLGTFGLPHVGVVVNRIDLTGFAPGGFATIAAAHRDFLITAGCSSADFIPLCARTGDNVFERSAALSWFAGPTLRQLVSDSPRLPRPNGAAEARTGLTRFRTRFLWYADEPLGTGGCFDMAVAASLRAVRVDRVNQVIDAGSGQPVPRTDVRRGEVADCECCIVGHVDPIVVGADGAVRFTMCVNGKLVGGGVATAIPGPDDLGARPAHAAAGRDEPGASSTGASRIRDSHTRSIAKALSWRVLGTVATTLIVFVMTRRLAVSIAVGAFEFVSKTGLYWLHERLWDRITFGRRELAPVVIWLTGLSGAGKSTLGTYLSGEIRRLGNRVEHLDGDAIRDIFPQTGFTRLERDAHVKRVGHLAGRLEKHGVWVVASFVSPYRESREFVRALCKTFVEVHVATPLEVCERRDPKGLYARARRGEITNFTGIDDPYESPSSPDVVVDLTAMPTEEAGRKVMAAAARRLGRRLV